MNWNPNEKDPWGRKNNNPPDLDDAIDVRSINNVNLANTLLKVKKQIY